MTKAVLVTGTSSGIQWSGSTSASSWPVGFPLCDSCCVAELRKHPGITPACAHPAHTATRIARILAHEG